MSGALNSVFSGTIGKVLNVGLEVGLQVAFPQLAIANALGNMVAGAVGDAVKGAVEQMTKEGGMPKFIGNLIKDAVSQMTQNCTAPCDPKCGNAVQDKVGKLFADFAKELCSEIVDAFKKHKCECDKAEGGGKGGSKSWFVALMKALGEVQNQQAAKVEKLSKEVSDALGAGDDSAGSKQAQFDKMEEFKAEAKIQEVFANCVKSIADSIGRALGTAAQPNG